MDPPPDLFSGHNGVSLEGKLKIIDFETRDPSFSNKVGFALSEIAQSSTNLDTTDLELKRRKHHWDSFDRGLS